MVVYSHSPHDSRHWSYALLGTSTAIWSFGYFSWQMSDSPASALVFTRVLMAGAIFIPLTFFHHVLTLIQAEDRQYIVLKMNYGLGVVFLLCCLGTPYFIAGVHPAMVFPYWPIPGPLFHIFLLWWVSMAAYPHYLLFRSYQEGNDLRKKQFLLIMVASGTAFIGGATNFPLWYGIEILPYGTIAFTVYVSFIAYALLRYHLLEFSVVLEKGLNYLAVLLLISQPAYPVLLLAQKSVFGAISLRFSLVQLFVHVLTVAGAYQMRVGTRGTIARTVLRGRQYQLETMSRFSTHVLQQSDLKSLGQEIVQTFGKGMRVRTAVLFLLDEAQHTYVPVSVFGPTSDCSLIPSFSVTDALPRYLAIVQARVALEELMDNRQDEWRRMVRYELERVHAEVGLPFMSKNRLLGFCLLGPSSSRSRDSSYDGSVITLLTQEAAVALENAILCEEIKHSRLMVQKINQLRVRDTVAEELVHALHSPLSSMRAFVQLAGLRKDDEGFLARFQTVLSNHLARIESLMNEMSEAEQSTTPHYEEENMNDLLLSCLSFLTTCSRYHTVTIEKELDPGLSSVFVDRRQIKQVLITLFLEALQSIDRVEKVLSVSSKPVRCARGEPWAQIDIIVSSKEHRGQVQTLALAPISPMPKLSEEGREMRNVTLAVAHQIIHNHHGQFRVARDRDDMTVYSVSLPVGLHSSRQDWFGRGSAVN